MSRFVERLNRFSLEERLYFLRHSPVQVKETGEMELLYRLLTNFEFMEVKTSALGPQPLIDDYNLSDDAMLRSIQHALRREAHVLTTLPDLLWQQLYNRLQWDEEVNAGILQDELERRNKLETKPWLHLKNPLRESSTLVRTLQSYTKIYACAIGPDGSFVVSAGETLTVWDLQTGKELLLEDHTGAVNDCAISPDGSFIVSAGNDYTLKIWDTQTWRLRAILHKHKNPVNTCAISSDGRFIVSAGYGRALKIWDVQTEQELATLHGHEASVTSCAISPDGALIVSISEDHSLKIWDRQTRQELRSLEVRYWGLQTCTFGFDSTFVISDTQYTAPDGTSLYGFKLWDVKTGQELDIFEVGHIASIRSCAVSSDGKILVSASDDQTLKIWDTTMKRELTTLIGHTDAVRDCAISSDGRFIVSASDDRTLKVWDVRTTQALATSNSSYTPVSVCIVSPDGKFAITGSKGTSLNIWDTKTGRQKTTLYTGTSSYETAACAISSDGTFVVSSAHDTLKIWDARTWQERVTLRGHASHINSCTISPDNTFVVSGGGYRDETLSIWDAWTGEELATLAGHESGINSCIISPDETFILSVDNKKLKAWDVQTAKLLSTVDGTSPLAISPDGSFIVSGYANDTLKLWKSKTNHLLRGHSAPIHTCSISPDGSFIVSGSEDMTLKIWDVRTGQERRTLHGHDGPINTCAISPDGAFIISGGSDSTLKFWDTKTCDEYESFPLPSAVHSVVMHPWSFSLVIGGSGENIYFIELIGLTYGPLIVTAVKHGNNLEVQCPKCREKTPVIKRQLGGKLKCKNRNCDMILNLNPFVVTIRTPAWAIPLDQLLHR